MVEQDACKKQAFCSTIFKNIYLVTQTNECVVLICMIDSSHLAAGGIHIFWMNCQNNIRYFAT